MTPDAQLESASDGRLLSYSKARLTAGLRASWPPGPESNRHPSDGRSAALPIELPRGRTRCLCNPHPGRKMSKIDTSAARRLGISTPRVAAVPCASVAQMSPERGLQPGCRADQVFGDGPAEVASPSGRTHRSSRVALRSRHDGVSNRVSQPGAVLREAQPQRLSHRLTRCDLRNRRGDRASAHLVRLLHAHAMPRFRVPVRRTMGRPLQQTIQLHTPRHVQQRLALACLGRRLDPSMGWASVREDTLRCRYGFVKRGDALAPTRGHERPA